MITKEELKELVENSLRVALIKSHLTFLVQKEDFRMINIYSDGGIMVTFFGHCGAEDDEIDIEFEDLNKTDEQLKQEVETELLRKEEEIKKDIEERKKERKKQEYKQYLKLKDKFEKVAK